MNNSPGKASSGGSPNERSPSDFDEIRRVHQIFEILETDSAQIGSGRPAGPRFHLWGSVVVLARSALEESTRRLHETLCTIPDCKHKNVQLDAAGFKAFLEVHGKSLPELLPDELHVALFQKAQSKAGSGSGVRVNGPLTSAEVLKYVGALSHTRNGFAHADPGKSTRPPPHGAGVLWVSTGRSGEWTIQKPHALSTIRICHTIYRLLVLTCWDEQTALDTRVELPLPIRERYQNGLVHNPVELGEGLLGLLKSGDLREALNQLAELRAAILGTHLSGQQVGVGQAELTIPGMERIPSQVGTNYADPVLSEKVGRSPSTLPNQHSLFSDN